jgi:hypothetical protein
LTTRSKNKERYNPITIIKSSTAIANINSVFLIMFVARGGKQDNWRAKMALDFE